MFDGVPAEQLHQFIASRASLPLPLPLSSFPLHHANSSTPNTFPSFDAYSPQHQLPLHHPPPPSPHFLHPILHQHSPNSHKHEEKLQSNLVSINSEIERERSLPEPIDPWTNEEVLALLRIRSTLENWCPDFTWEHVSRKLAELGCKRSAEKCKEKFEEESRYFNNINYCGSGKSYRFLGEPEELYHGENLHQNNNIDVEKNEENVEKPSEAAVEADKRGQSLDEDSTRNYETVVGKDSEDGDEKVVERSKSKKRKRQKVKFEMLKGFCVDIVNKLMAQQEETHNKLIEDMVKKEREKVAKEEAWKQQEMDRMNKELEIMAHEQSLAGDRQTSIIEFLKTFTSSSSSSSSAMISKFPQEKSRKSSNKVVKCSNPIPLPSSSLIQDQSSNPTSHLGNQNNLEELPIPSARIIGHHQNSCSSQCNQSNPLTTETFVPQNPSSSLAPSVSQLPTSSSAALSSQNPSSLNNQKSPIASVPSAAQKVPQNPTVNEKDDIRKRWPRDEVLALINLRCGLYNSGDHDGKEGTKAPLWERISQGMLELGYERSSKRCKEKWENINKYFRKTKDVNRKRSLDSRTCPYFHQLSTLYSKGSVVGPSEGQESCSVSQENHSSPALPSQETCKIGTQVISSSLHDADGHHQGERIDNNNNTNMVQVPNPGFDFEF